MWGISEGICFLTSRCLHKENGPVCCGKCQWGRYYFHSLIISFGERGEQQHGIQVSNCLKLMLVWIKEVRFGSRLLSRKLSGHVYKQMRQWSHLSHHSYTSGKLYKPSFCTYSIFISLVNTENCNLYRDFILAKGMDFTQKKRFPHCHSGFRLSLWNSEKSHSHHIENFIHCPWVELNICCAIKPDHVKSLIHEHLSLFQDLKYQQTFFVDKLNETGRKHTANTLFSVFNQYSSPFLDDLFPCTLCYSISHHNSVPP